MFGLTLEKLFLVALVAAMIIGPQRFALYTRGLSRTVRSLRGFVEATRARAERDLGMPLSHAEWQALNLRQYDPRAIVREALDDRKAFEDREALAGASGRIFADDVETARHRAPTPDIAQSAGTYRASDTPQITQAAPGQPDVDGLDRVRPGQKYLIVGDSAHPRRILLSSLAIDDPRRVAAKPVIERQPAPDGID